MIECLTKSKHPVHTITFDKDKGFGDRMSIANALNADNYCIRPYTSQDKGTVANRIGQMSRFCLKRMTLVL